MRHEPADLLALLDSDALDPSEQRRVRAHTESCAPCRAEAARLRQVPLLIGGPPGDGWTADVAPAIRARLAAPPSPASAGAGPHVAAARPTAAPPPCGRPRPLAVALLGLVLTATLALALGGRFLRGPAAPPRPPAAPPAPLLDSSGALTATAGGYTLNSAPGLRRFG